MPRISAGILMFRRREGVLQLLLAHPGGPYFQNKDLGAWTIPKGEVADGEDLFAAALREFEEEIGFQPVGKFIQLSPIKQKGVKVVHAWAVEGDFDPTTARSNTYSIEWPPCSGKRVKFPEVDRAEFFEMDVATTKINPAQAALIVELHQLITRP